MEGINEAIGEGKANGNLDGPIHMCQRFLIDPAAKFDQAYWSSLALWIYMLQGKIPEARRHAYMADGPIGTAAVRYLKSIKARTQAELRDPDFVEQTRVAWRRMFASVTSEAQPLLAM